MSKNKKPEAGNFGKFSDKQSEDLTRHKTTKSPGYIQSKFSSNSILIDIYGVNHYYDLTEISHFIYTPKNNVLIFRMFGEKLRVTGVLAKQLHMALCDLHLHNRKDEHE